MFYFTTSPIWCFYITRQYRKSKNYFSLKCCMLFCQHRPTYKTDKIITWSQVRLPLHNLKLTIKNSSTSESDFITRMLLKTSIRPNIASHLCHYVFTLHFLLYCIFLYLSCMPYLTLNLFILCHAAVWQLIVKSYLNWFELTICTREGKSQDMSPTLSTFTKSVMVFCEKLELFFTEPEVKVNRQYCMVILHRNFTGTYSVKLQFVQ